MLIPSNSFHNRFETNTNLGQLHTVCPFVHSFEFASRIDCRQSQLRRNGKNWQRPAGQSICVISTTWMFLCKLTQSIVLAPVASSYLNWAWKKAVSSAPCNRCVLACRCCCSGWDPFQMQWKVLHTVPARGDSSWLGFILCVCVCVASVWRGEQRKTLQWHHRSHLWKDAPRCLWWCRLWPR